MIKQKIEQLDAKTGSVYDYALHAPVPTIETVRNQTGIDVLEFSDTSLKARAELKMLTRLAKNIFTSWKTRNSANDFEFLIATEEMYRVDFIDYVCQFIYDVFYNGLMEKLNDIVVDGDLVDNLTLSSISVLKGSSLRSNSLLGVKYKYREGY